MTEHTWETQVGVACGRQVLYPLPRRLHIRISTVMNLNGEHQDLMVNFILNYELYEGTAPGQSQLVPPWGMSFPPIY